jgi:hypothetical protein
MRMMIANLSAPEGETVDINNLPQSGEIASARAPFDHFLLIDSGLLTHDEADCLRPRLYEEIAPGTEDDECDKPDNALHVRFAKVHDAYTMTPKGEPLLAGRRGAEGAVVIVRDPRDVAPSLANHNGSSIDKAITFMGDPKSAFCGKSTKHYIQLRQKLLSWSKHIASWLDQRDIPVHLVRYEEMKADPAAVLRAVLDFAGFPATEAQIRSAATNADFTKLRAQELEKGFREAPRRLGDTKFFRRGVTGAWRDELTIEQVARIESEHETMMRRLGYEPSGVTTLALMK